MKTLKRMLLIHWHYFNHEIINFDGINLLTGRNSSGKSTIIDAIQLVLLSDTSGSFFNKAASIRGNRTLNGYLRCELGDDENAGFRYLRNGRFTSYIVLEFHDDVRKNIFSAGCCFDTFGENDMQKLFFRFDGGIPDNEFVENNLPFNIERLRIFLRTNYPVSQSYTTGVNRDFREVLCGNLGGLQPSRFSDLIKKAVSFNPNVDIRQFITEFVCGNEQKVTIDDMQDNIRSYDLLKKESEILVERIHLLSNIGKSFNEFIHNKNNELLYSYLIERAALEIKETDIERQKKKAAGLTQDLADLSEKLKNSESRRHQLQSERDNLKLQLDSNEDARRYDELLKQVEALKRQCSEYVNEFDGASALLQRALSSWISYITNIDGKTSDDEILAVDPILRERIEALAAEGNVLLNKAEAFRGADAEKLLREGKEALDAISAEADAYRDRCTSLASRLHDAREESASKYNELRLEKESLEKGIYKFPQDAVDLKEAIESRLRARFGPEAKAYILAEAAEIRDDRWRNVIEGYLNTQKFYVIVEPEHFNTAFQLYDSIKRKKQVYATGLVDTEKLLQLNPSRDDGSLAEELESPVPAAVLFINYTLGRVHKCDSIKELRRHMTSITDDGVLYQSYVVRALDPKRWKDPAIGLGGAKRRLEIVNGELAALSRLLNVYGAIIPALKTSERFTRLSESDVERIIQSAKLYMDLPELKNAISRLTADAESIDKSEMEILRLRLAERENALADIEAAIRKNIEKTGAVKKELQICAETILPTLETEMQVMRVALENAYDKTWVENTGSPRYTREYNSRSGADEILKAFPREQSRSRNAKDEAWEQTRDLRNRYNETFKTGYNVNAGDNEEYQRMLTEFADNRLPEYQAKIEDTRNKAYQQFQEDFLSKLQSNIFNARRHIDDLNASMKNASFGEDVYQFRIMANPEYKRYYDMIVDEMLLVGGYNLLSEQYNAKYKDEIAELFELITNDGGAQNAAVYEDYEKRVQVFTDYKTYLHFDLEVIKPNGDSERLSRTMGKKSGGETQTPFYIAVLASFVQLYRVGRDKIPNTARLIIFDEAFSKMDGERIIQSIDLLRRFQFQVIFAAPPDKIPDIAVLADRNLCVLRDGYKTRVRAFEPRQLDMLIGDSEAAV